MKKFLTIALMALTVGFMVSCANTKYRLGGPQPIIDREAGTVNGKSYDTTVEKCWQVDIKTTILGATTSSTNWEWLTEFALVADYETQAYWKAQAGIDFRYTYAATSDPDADTCWSNRQSEQ